ncbi:MAG TPA: sigma-70 family RNA polymerase sigma factor [Planctomycetota bacterium]|jgi:RNA polymerase primary sigma factor|nr:sigma-70 family RNA polymerase sigma factor [Planctomycetota bacterium]
MKNIPRRELPTDTLEIYMREARQHDLLTPEEEKQLLEDVVRARNEWLATFLNTEAALSAVWEDLSGWKEGRIAALALIPGPPRPADEKSGPTRFCKRLHKIFAAHVARHGNHPFRDTGFTRRLVLALLYVGFRPAPMDRYREIAMAGSSKREVNKIDRARQKFLQTRLPLIEKNLRLVMKLAHTFVPGPLSYAELIQEGNLGLIRSTESFAPRFGVRFSTYAYLWIRQSILRALENKSRTIRLPVSLTQALRKLEREQEEGMASGRLEDGSYATGQLANPTVSRPILSLDQGIDDESDLSQVVADSRTEMPHTSPINADTGAFIRTSLSSLPDRQRLILRLRFGIDCKRPHTLTEIGQLLGVSAERVRQLQQLAFDSLRESHSGEALAELAMN